MKEAKNFTIEPGFTVDQAEKAIYNEELRKFRKKEWDAANQDKVALYRRATTLRRCQMRCSVPTKNTVMRYKFTKEELKPIFDALWEKWSTVDSDSPDTADNSSGDNE